MYARTNVYEGSVDNEYSSSGRKQSWKRGKSNRQRWDRAHVATLNMNATCADTDEASQYTELRINKIIYYYRFW